MLRGSPECNTATLDAGRCGRTRDAAGGAREPARGADEAGKEGPDAPTARSKLAIANRTETIVTSNVARNLDASAARPRPVSNELGGREETPAFILRPA